MNKVVNVDRIPKLPQHRRFLSFLHIYLRAVFFKDDLIERSTILDFVHFLRSNPQIYEKFEYETIFPNYN